MRRRATTVAALLAFSVGCSSGGGNADGGANAGPNASGNARTDDAYLAMAKECIATVTAPGAPWTGPTTGPTAQGKKLIVYVSSDQRNGGRKEPATGRKRPRR